MSHQSALSRIRILARSQKMRILALSCTMLCAPIAAHAQQSGQLGEIIVTAQKRSETAQNVPVAISSLDPIRLERASITDTTELKQLSPALNFNTNLGGFGQPRIRGIGTTATGPGIENPVATYVDGVYIGSSTGAIFQLADVQQVDILKGPQGTLFGRNATGGVIQVTTKAPSQDFHAAGQIRYGNYDTWGGSAYLSGGLAKGLTASVAGVFNQQDKGYGMNLATGHQVQKGWDFGLRAKLHWASEDGATSITLAGDYAKLNRSDPAIRTFQGLTIAGTPTPGGMRDINLNVDPRVNTRQGGGMLNIRHDFAAIQLVSITAYREAQLFTIIDADQTPANSLTFSEIQKDRQFTQEVQLLSTAKGPFKWVLGGFYMWSQGKYDPITTRGVLACGYACADFSINQNVKQTLNSYAAFAQGSYAIDPATNLTLGLRYTGDRRQMEESQTITTVPFFGATSVVNVNAPLVSKTFPKLTWRVALDHRFSPQAMAYASYNRGFKSGSYQPDSFPPQVLQPETVDAFEVGLKTDLMDRRVRLNLSAFYYDYTNIQANQIIQGQLYVYNAPGSINYGLDADLAIKVTPELTLTASAAWLHARYKNGFNTAFWSVPIPNAASNANPFFHAVGGNSVIQCVAGTNYAGTVFAPCDASGRHVQNTPDVTLNAGFDYTTSLGNGTISLAGNAYYNGGYYDDPQNRLQQRHYTLLDASLTYSAPGDRWYAKAWGKNLADAFYSQQQNALDVGDNRVAAPPRTYGVTLGFKY
ncbi:TonB-dependent receptor [Novosphingobium sediminicola]|uniref:Iron complex outermembrane receptor protein n=1 Tax=Novosphingobium sediminicola TaxID=563162 RepID=A0A7W6G6W6_9SPHN|nr:TonB-dependent receptor [Novosphingobium sediminicola]MBB3954372.1 iron complex outermembrane receptor protein [Novosphingobium sediminicola]